MSFLEKKMVANMEIKIYQVDAFTDAPFGGNPAAVCPLDQWLEENTMQAIAAENNLSETAFFVQTQEGFDIRYFTPETEIDLCGHATLGSAHVVFNHLDYKGDNIRFNSNVGPLYITKKDDLLVMDFPSWKPEPMDVPDILVEALGKRPLETYKSRDCLAVFETEEDVLSIHPDYLKFKELDFLGIIITAKGKKVDFVSRFFAPAAGIPEDPVTGSAHCILTPFWSGKLGKKELHALQISKRGGELWVEDRDERVSVAGKAVTVIKGVMYL